MNRHVPPALPSAERPAARFFSLLFGAFLGLCLVKFGNVVIFEHMIARPTNGWEWVLAPWPLDLGYKGLIAVGVLSLFAAGWRSPKPVWLFSALLLWFGWQLIAATHTVDVNLTKAIIQHFAACIASFGLGYFALSAARTPGFLFGLTAGFAIVLATGLQQRFGGLEDTRRFLEAYPNAELARLPPEFFKKLQSDRIWATQFYPNALAGVILLLLPPIGVFILQSFTRLTLAARQFVAAAVGSGALACLYWSGSKGGWLLALLMALVAVLWLDFPRRWKLVVMAGVVITGLAGFAWKYAGFFQRGATSVGARFDYWEAAVATTRANPVFGSGPGTFAIPYQRLKRPESEMSRLVHNDYLQQASDSGLPGFLAYAVFTCGWLVWRGRSAFQGPNPLHRAMWLGLAGWLAQGLMEFGLYIPALAWTAFALMGWLAATGNEFDNPSRGP